MNSMMCQRKRTILFVGCAAAAFVSLSALAQSTVLADDADPNEIIVTTQKRSQSISEVLGGVSVVTPDLLKSVHATQLTDVSAYIPAFQVVSAGSARQTTISIRGIAPIVRAGTVATYFYDTPVGSSTTYNSGNSFQLDLLPYDVEKDEILRGPQGTLCGASSMGGLLKYALTSPSLDVFKAQFGTRLLTVQGAGKLGYGVRANLSGPLIAGKLGAVASYSSIGIPTQATGSVA